MILKILLILIIIMMILINRKIRENLENLKKANSRLINKARTLENSIEEIYWKSKTAYKEDIWKSHKALKEIEKMSDYKNKTLDSDCKSKI